MTDAGYWAWIKEEEKRSEPEAICESDQELTEKVFANPRVKARVEEYLARRHAGQKSEPVTMEELWRGLDKVRRGED